MCRVCRFLLAFIALAMGNSQRAPGQSADTLLSFLPDTAELPGISVSDTPRVFRGEDLYLFIDGGADLFFEYGFRRVTAVGYRNSGTINLEIYEMSDPGAAYGIYSIRSGKDAISIDVGQGGCRGDYYLMFWKGRHYVTLASSDSSAESMRALMGIARAVDRRIPERGGKPRIMYFLAGEGLQKQKYFRGFLGLSTTRLFASKDIFRAGEGAAGVYKDHTLFLMRYKSSSEARNRFGAIEADLKSEERYRDFRTRSGMLRVKDRDKQVFCFSLSGAYIVLSISPDAGTAQATCAKAAELVGRR